MSKPTALHSKKTVKWGTPTHIIELARILLDNEIHLDPATSLEFNQLVKALLIYTDKDNGLLQPWGGNVFVNPPGGLIVEFWEKLIKEIQGGEVEKAFWVGFSIEQLCLLSDQPMGPQDFSLCVLRKRLDFNTEQLNPGGSPSHGNYVVGLGVDHEEFERLFSKLGKVTRGVYA